MGELLVNPNVRELVGEKWQVLGSGLMQFTIGGKIFIGGIKEQLGSMINDHILPSAKINNQW